LKAITFFPESEHKEGVGSIYQSILFAYLFSRYINVPFIYFEPSFYRGHYPNSKNVSESWFSIFKFLNKYKSDKIECIDSFSNYIDGNYNFDEVVVNIDFNHSHNILKKLKAENFNKLVSDLRHEFWGELNTVNKIENNKYVVALHLRDLNEGDVVFDKKSLPWQYFSFDYKLVDNNHKYYCELYSSCVNNLLKNNHYLNIDLHIHTNAKAEILKPLIEKIHNKINVKTFISSPIDTTFIDFLTADMLVAYHSSFSWIATMLRKDPSLIRKNFRHIIFENTKIIEENFYYKGSYFLNIYLFFKKLYFLLKFKFHNL
jgi:hypothetical protein